MPLPPELAQLSARMRALARGQGGVLTAVECRVVGADKRSVRRLLDAGEWLTARRGTYRDPRFHPPLPAVAEFHRRCAALLAALSGPAVISHLSAARLLRLPLPPGPPTDRISVTRRPPAAFNDPLGGDVYVHDYAEADVRRIGGVPVLAGARLVLDCCAELPPDSALAIADACLRRRLVTPDGLLDAAEQVRGRRERDAATRVAERADRGAVNWFESVSRWWLLEAGLPVPRLQAPFADRNGEIRAAVDMWFPDQRTVGEADGALKYDEPGALFEEKQREDWLRDAHRVEVVRWVPAEMRAAAGREEVVRRFRRAFARSS